MKKYNIGLIPKFKSEEIIKVAEHFYSISDEYKLGHNSLPHVTLFQFQANENDIKNLWDRIILEIPDGEIELELKNFSCLSFDNKTNWISLMPDHRDILTMMHERTAAIINLPINKSYDPHLTLISSKNSEYKNIAENYINSYTPISDTFVLALGECDSIGQFTKLLHICDVSPKIKIRM